MKKALSVLLCILFLFSFAGCGNQTASSNVSGSSEDTGVSGNKFTSAGNQLKVTYPDNDSITSDKNPVFKWTKISGAESYALKVEKYQDGNFETVIDQANLTDTSFQNSSDLDEGAIYRFHLSASVNGKTVQAYNIPETGGMFMNWIDTKNYAANKGIDYSFKDSISENVLNNYLGRAITMSVYTSDDVNYNNNSIRMIINTGAKYISRSYGPWLPNKDQEMQYDKLKNLLGYAHQLDDDIIFEACIFETTWSGVNSFSIPDWVFEAFGKTPENRSFNFQKMLFPDHRYTNQFGDGISVPDITQLETQMFVYYRACTFIDLGFEALHLGQTQMTGSNDPNFRNYEKVIKLIRDYAKQHARRGYVIINSHNSTSNFANKDQVFLADFIKTPAMVFGDPQSAAHLPSEDNPQKALIYSGQGVYNTAPKGTSPSGWTTDKYPYLVEFDNSMSVPSDPKTQLSKPGTQGAVPWGYDEISWFTNQPASYRQSFLKYMTDTVKSFDPENGHFEMPGNRPSYILKDNKMDYYYASSKLFSDAGYNDEDSIKQIWLNSAQ